MRVDLTRSTVDQARSQLWEVINRSESVILDLSLVRKIDSAGAALLGIYGRELEQQHRQLKLVRVASSVRDVLILFPYVEEFVAPTEKKPILATVGQWTYSRIYLGGRFLSLLADTVIFALQALARPHTVRWPVIFYEMSTLGSQATAVVATIAGLVGATMALQSAAQLRQFGASVLVVDLIGISMTRELGPLMAAIVVAGRSGSAIAAEVGTMVINEEIDALKTMGIRPLRFIVVPKLLAISITQPLLTMVANASGILGGLVVAIFYLDISAAGFIDRLIQSILVSDILGGLCKAFVFAQIIIVVGAFCGFETKGGSDAVGRAATRSVVASIFCVIFTDALASLVLYAWEYST